MTFDADAAFDAIYNELGADGMLDALWRALNTDEQRENADYIARCHDIDLDQPGEEG